MPPTAILAMVALFLATPPARAATAGATNPWSTALLRDAQAIHDDMAANSPGPVDPFQPGFAARSDAALAQARVRAAQVKGPAGYVFALRAQVASYDDGHVGLRVDPGPGALSWRWPGFLTGIDAEGAARVMTRAADAPVPLGAELVACDGIPVAALAERNLAPFAGRWGLASQRIGNGGQLLLDTGNPFVPRPVACDLRVGTQPVRVTLVWRPLSASEAKMRLAETTRRAHPAIGARTLPDGTRWFTLSRFDSDPASPAGQALVKLIAQMKHDRDAIRIAPVVVLDLRGNDGGSSDWSDQVGAVIWGGAANDAWSWRQPGAVDWRVSPANLATMAGYERMFSANPGMSPHMLHWVRETAGGLRTALGQGKPFWRAPETPLKDPPGGPEAPPGGVVFVLTDDQCISACLDALERWRGLGAVQIGLQTSADTYDMDVRTDKLPSGLGVLDVPMKVYRDRSRGWNVPFTPTYLYPGDMRDEAALDAWVAGLPR